MTEVMKDSKWISRISDNKKWWGHHSV